MCTEADIDLALEAYSRLKAKPCKTSMDEMVLTMFEAHVRELASGARIMLALAREGRADRGPGEVVHWTFGPMGGR